MRCSRAALTSLWSAVAVTCDFERLCRYELSLYAHISNVVWDSSAQGSNQVAGTVVDKRAHNIQHFSLEEGSLTHFELVNKLWGIVD